VEAGHAGGMFYTTNMDDIEGYVGTSDILES
jgi:hypothetical protein